MRRDEPEPETIEPIRPWDNSGLRNRVEGREIEGIDVRALQDAAAARDEGSGGRRRRRS